MKVESIRNTTPIIKQEKTSNETTDQKENQKITETPAAVYEKSQNIEKNHIYDKATITKLKRESQQTHAQLIRLVEEMLKRQGKSLKLLETENIIEVDETARLEAEALIGPDGPLSPEAVSNRLVDFAIAISGGDKSKADTLKSAIEQGFKEAEKILGELPEISKETHRLTMEKFDAWVAEE